MKKSRIVKFDDREYEIVDVSDDLDVVDEKLRFDRLLFSREEVIKLVKLILNDLDRFEKKYEHFKSIDFKLESSFECYLDEEENVLRDDLDYLVTFLNIDS